MTTENFKYYGFIYEGEVMSYNLDKNAFTFDNPYDALKNANDKWNANPDLQIARLLVVVMCEISSESKKYAFFQFTDSEACEFFILKKKEINWSSDKEQNWNGNAHLMTPIHNKP